MKCHIYPGLTDLLLYFTECSRHPSFNHTIFMRLFQGLVERLQDDIEYKQNKYRDDLSSVTSGLDSLYEYINSGPVDFKM